MNPGVIAPSHTPRKNRAANKPPKLLQAAWQNNAIDQRKTLILGQRSASDGSTSFFFDKPHPFPDGPPLESQALGVHEKEVREEKDRPEPVKLVCRKVVRLTNAHGSSDEMNWDRGEFTHMIPSTADWPSAILSMKVTL